MRLNIFLALRRAATRRPAARAFVLAAVVVLAGSACGQGENADAAGVHTLDNAAAPAEQGAPEVGDAPKRVTPEPPDSGILLDVQPSAQAAPQGLSLAENASEETKLLAQDSLQAHSVQLSTERVSTTSVVKIYFPPSVVWRALRECESSNNYGFVDATGVYHGAYQFTTRTWNRLAARLDPGLVEVLPSEASPLNQDAMAVYLWSEAGSGRWPECAHVFDRENAEAYLATLTSSSSAGDSARTTDAEQTTSTSSVSTSSTTSTEPEANPSTLPAVIPDIPGFPSQEQWAALRQCESSNNYRVVSRNGRYYGAYQFWPDTWDFVAKDHYPRLLGVLPSLASPQDQDRMAYKLWEQRGDQPWPICGRYLR